VDVVKPRACRSDSNQFRASLVSAPVQAVFARHRRALERVFTHYAALDKTAGNSQKGSSGVGGNTINHPEFVSMCKDCRLFDNAFTELAAGIVFANVQQEEVDEACVSVGGGYGEMVFSEFLEAVGAVCLYKSPMPYEPLEQRLDNFIAGSLLKHAGQKAAHAHARGGGSGGGATAAEVAEARRRDPAREARVDALMSARETASLLGPW
jgi:hypothetical protein